jgi:hypothetical protein
MLWTIALLVAGGLLFLLFVPIRLELNTRTASYRAWIAGLAGIELLTEPEMHFRLRMLGFSKDFDPFASKKAHLKRRRSGTRRKNARRLHSWKWIRKGLQVVRSFRLERFYLDVDANDYVANALLVPILARLAGKNVQCRINFNSEIELQILVSNNLARALFAFVK